VDERGGYIKKSGGGGPSVLRGSSGGRAPRKNFRGDGKLASAFTRGTTSWGRLEGRSRGVVDE